MAAWAPPPAGLAVRMVGASFRWPDPAAQYGESPAAFESPAVRIAVRLRLPCCVRLPPLHSIAVRWPCCGPSRSCLSLRRCCCVWSKKGAGRESLSFLDALLCQRKAFVLTVAHVDFVVG